MENEVFAVDGSGRVHVAENVLLGDGDDVFASVQVVKEHAAENVLLGDERDALVSDISHEVAAPVMIAPGVDAIQEWLAEGTDSDTPTQEEALVRVPAKRYSGGSDPSKVKWPRSITLSLVSRDSRASKAGMSGSKHSSGVVDKQPRRGK
ncbi:hypothetical protein V6N11_021612 [Hibiscus sabdariffa]|uniref:Uncharacterized protein n=1 Tax=Hibiscus sabdariffa TaxID=183260 RepID=A0ABR2PBN5_9ROSI